MVEQDANGGEPQMTELDLLKQRAKMLNIAHSGNIGVEALRKKINDKLEGIEEAPVQNELVPEDGGPSRDDPFKEEDSVGGSIPEMSPMPKPTSDSRVNLNPLMGDILGSIPSRRMSLREQQIKDCMRLVRCRITNLDPKKKDLHGEILTVGNQNIGTVKKFIPYGELTDNGYHIPKILYDELESRKFLHIQISRPQGSQVPVVNTTYAKEFAIEVLPPLTKEELAKLANAQLAANA